MSIIQRSTAPSVLLALATLSPPVALLRAAESTEAKSPASRGEQTQNSKTSGSETAHFSSEQQRARLGHDRRPAHRVRRLRRYAGGASEGL